MSDILPESNFQATYEGYPVVANRIFRCLECQQYVVFTSSLLETSAKVDTSISTSISNVKTLNQSDLSQQPISYDLLTLPFPPSDYLKPMQSLDSFSNALDSSSFLPMGISPVSFPQVTYSSYSPTREAGPRRDEAAVLRSEIEQLKDIVRGLRDRYAILSYKNLIHIFTYLHNVVKPLRRCALIASERIFLKHPHSFKRPFVMEKI